MNVLLAGGAGFLGKNLARHWTTRFPEDRVVVIDTFRRHRSDVGILDALAGVFVAEADITDVCFVERVLVEHRVDLVVNLTSVASVERAAADPQAAIRSNISTAASLLEACRRVGDVRYHQVSSAEVFGSALIDSPVGEDAPYAPGTVYGASKAGADHLVRAYHRCNRVPITISIAPNTYGPYQRLDQVLPRFVTEAILGRPLPIYGDGSFLREWLHVSDHCSGIAAVARNGQPGATYNLASDQLVTVGTIARMVLASLGRPPSLISLLPNRPGNRSRPALDGGKAAGQLGWRAMVRFGDGLRSTVGWYLDNPDWWMPAADPVSARLTPAEVVLPSGGRP